MKHWQESLMGIAVVMAVGAGGFSYMNGRSVQSKIDSVENSIYESAATQARNHLTLLAYLDAQDLTSARRVSIEALESYRAMLSGYPSGRGNEETRHFVGQINQRLAEHLNTSRASGAP